MGKFRHVGVITFWVFWGILMTIIGLISTIQQPITPIVKNITYKQMALFEGSLNYKIWSSPIALGFICYIFNVTNPQEVMQGALPQLVEYGPFSYTEVMEKQIIETDEEKDEIVYMTKSQYIFNKKESVPVSARDKVTVLNPAYIGTISTLTKLPPVFMEQHGENIPKLFPKQDTIFMTAKPLDILFNGVKITCNQKKYPELALICQTLKSSKPPTLRDSDKEGIYLFSFFSKRNGSLSGPYVVNRGVKNVSLLGNIDAFNGERVQNIWDDDKCDKVRGTDSITWPPLIKQKFVTTFTADLCRAIDADYTNTVSIHGVTGSKFVMTERAWFTNETDCYCPLVKTERKCLPRGLLDISKCQEAPIYYSEPHFLHSDPNLLQFAQGLKPVERLHETFIIIEPLTGAPLNGQKRSQLNLHLTKQPVQLLKSVSEGYFPLVWFENGNAPGLSVISAAFQLHRILNLVWFLQIVPLIVGIYIILAILFLYATPDRKVRSVNLTAESVLISSNLQMRNLTHRPPRKTL